MKQLHLLLPLLLLMFFNLQAQTWTGTGDGVNYHDPANWSPMSIPHLGQATINVGDTATILSGNIADWPGGSLVGGGAIINEGLITISTTSLKILRDNTTLISSGEIHHQGGELQINEGVIINNGLYTMEDGTHLDNGLVSSTFINNDSIVKNIGSGSAHVDVSLFNSGVLEVRDGSMRLTRASTFFGGSMINIAANTTLDFQLGDHSFQGLIGGNVEGVFLMGSNFYGLGEGILDVDGEIICDNCAFRGDTLTFEDTLSIANSALSFLHDSVKINIKNRMIVDNVTLRLIEGCIDNYGTIELMELGSIDIQNSTYFDLNNHGTILKKKGNNLSRIEANLLNTGTIEAQIGILSIRHQAQYADGSILKSDLGSEVVMEFGDHTFLGDLAGIVAGDFVLDGDIYVNDTATFLIEATTCKGCSFYGGGTFIFDDKLIFSTNGRRFVDDSTHLIIQDTLVFEDGELDFLDGRVINEGVIDFTSDLGAITYTGLGLRKLINTHDGIILKSAGSGTNTIVVNTDNLGRNIVESGTIRFGLSMSSYDSTIYEGNGTFSVKTLFQADQLGMYGIISPGIGAGDIGVLTWQGGVNAHLRTDISGNQSDKVIFTDQVPGVANMLESSSFTIHSTPTSSQYSIAQGIFDVNNPDCGECEYPFVEGFNTLIPYVKPQYTFFDDSVYVLEHFNPTNGIQTCEAINVFVVIVDKMEEKLTISSLANYGDKGEFGTVSEIAKPGDTIFVDPSLNGEVLRPGFYYPYTGPGTPRAGCTGPCLCEGISGEGVRVDLDLTYFANPGQQISIKDTLNPENFFDSYGGAIISSGTMTYDGFDFLIQGELHGNIAGVSILDIFNYDLVIKNADIRLSNENLDGIEIKNSTSGASGSVTLGPGTSIYIDP